MFKLFVLLLCGKSTVLFHRAKALRRISQEEAAGNERAVPFIDVLVAAGPFGEAQLVAPEQYIEVPQVLRDPAGYFVCKVVGESMNRVIPNGSYCLFRRYEGGSRNGKIVLVQSTEIQDAGFGAGYTVKEYRSVRHTTADTWQHESIQLRALSNDPACTDIELKQNALLDFRVLGTFEKVL